MEMRKDKRFRLQLRCYLMCGRTNSVLISGITEEISRSGLLVRCDQNPIAKLPSAGEYVPVDLELPTGSNRAKPRSLHCHATVVGTRTGAGGETYVALAVDQMQFRDFPAQCFQAEDGEGTPSLLM